MKFFTNLFAHIENWLKSGKPQADLAKVDAVLVEVAELFPKALEAVQAISALVPNKTLAEAAAAAQEYGGPVATAIAGDPNAVNNILLNVATAALQKNLSALQASAATNLLNTAVQLAVTVTKA